MAIALFYFLIGTAKTQRAQSKAEVFFVFHFQNDFSLRPWRLCGE
ncbi:MAG: hypothetical protein NUV34_00495 [Sulfuricaulis sp.]|nr:hypothetical protein [Sulfuricaulis sp.]